MNILFASETEKAEFWLPLLERDLPDDRFFVTHENPVDIALVATPPAGALGQLKGIKLIQSLWMGVEKLLADPGLPKGVALARLIDPGMVAAMSETVTYHVLDKRDERPHTPARHEEEAKVRFTVEREAVDVLGFYAPRHRGIFTPRDSDLHMHLRTADGRASGHVERIAVEAGATIAVPRKETR